MPNLPIRRSLVLSLALVSALVLAGPAPAVAPAADPPRPSTVAYSVARAELNKLLSAQAVAWNRGDLDAFVAGYAEDATLLTSSGVASGRKAILAHYRQRYPDGKGRGTLTLTVIDALPLSVDVGSGTVNGLGVAAHWALAHPEDANAKPTEGSTLLVLQRRGGRWEILQDASM